MIPEVMLERIIWFFFTEHCYYVVFMTVKINFKV